MITHRAPAGDSKRGLVPPGDTRPAIVTYRKAGCAPPRRPGQRPDALPPGDNSQQPERMPCDSTWARRTSLNDRWHAERRIGMPTEAIGICKPTLTEHQFGHGGWLPACGPAEDSSPLAPGPQ